MKKLWKSSAALVMSAAFVVSGAACGAPVTDSSDSPSTGGSAASGLSAGYVAGALEQFASAKSVKVSINAEADVYASYGEGDEISVIQNEAYILQGEIILSQAETGVNMSLTATGNIKDNVTSETAEIGASVYVIGDEVYVYDEECGIYIVQSLSYTEENMGSGFGFGIFDSIAADLEEMIADIDTAEVIDMLVSLLDEYGTVNETSASISLSYDAATVFNLIITQINGIDEETKTLEEAINAVLGLVGDVKIDDILDAVVAFGPLTMAQVTTQLDSVLSAYGVSLKDIKDAVVAEAGNELFDQLVAGGMLTEAQANALKTGTIEETLAAFGLTDMTFNDFCEMIYSAIFGSGSSDSEDDNWSKLYSINAVDDIETAPIFDLYCFIEDTVKPYLKNTTLAAAGIYLPELDGITVNKAKAGAEIVLGKNSVEKLELSCEFGMVRRAASEEGVASTKVDLAAKIALEELNTSPVTISLPENAKIVYAVWNENLEATTDGNECWANIYFDFPVVEEDTVKYYGVIEISNIQGYGYIRYEFEYEPLASADISSISVTVLRAEVCDELQSSLLEGEELKAFLGGSVTFTLEVELGCIDVSAFPGLGANIQ